MERHTPMRRTGSPGRRRLRVVPDPGQARVLSFPQQRAAAAAKVIALAARRRDREALAVLSGTARQFPPPPLEADEDTDPEFAADVRDLIVGRFPGLRCDLAGFLLTRCQGMAQAHHRVPKGSGGSTRGILGGPANGLALCAACHQWVHDHPAAAKLLGLLLSKFTSDPAPQRLSLDGGVTWLVLDNAGGYRHLTGGAA